METFIAACLFSIGSGYVTKVGVVATVLPGSKYPLYIPAYMLQKTILMYQNHQKNPEKDHDPEPYMEFLRIC